MRSARSILLAAIIAAGPVAIFCLLGALPLAYVGWLGGGFVGIVAVMAVPGLACIAMLKLLVWQRAVAAALYLIVYAPTCLFPGVIASCMLSGCKV